MAVVAVGGKAPTSLSFVDERGAAVGFDALREGGPAVLFFMRTSTCPVCLRHVRALAGLAGTLAERGVRPYVVVPGGEADRARVQRRAGTLRALSSGGTAAHGAVGLGRTLMMQHSGTLLVDAAGRVAYVKTSAMPVASFSPKELTAAVRAL